MFITSLLRSSPFLSVSSFLSFITVPFAHHHSFRSSLFLSFITIPFIHHRSFHSPPYFSFITILFIHHHFFHSSSFLFVHYSLPFPSFIPLLFHFNHHFTSISISHSSSLAIPLCYFLTSIISLLFLRFVHHHITSIIVPCFNIISYQSSYSLYSNFNITGRSQRFFF